MPQYPSMMISPSQLIIQVFGQIFPTGATVDETGAALSVAVTGPFRYDKISAPQVTIRSILGTSQPLIGAAGSQDIAVDILGNMTYSGGPTYVKLFPSASIVATVYGRSEAERAWLMETLLAAVVNPIGASTSFTDVDQVTEELNSQTVHIVLTKETTIIEDSLEEDDPRPYGQPFVGVIEWDAVIQFGYQQGGIISGPLGIVTKVVQTSSGPVTESMG